MQKACASLAGTPRKSGATTLVRIVLKQALKRKWHHLASERIEDVSPTIPIGKSFWPLSAPERREIDKLFCTEGVQKLVTGLHNRHKSDEVRVRDAAYWVKGCSSLGRFRFAVLLEVGKRHREGRFCLIDIKEAIKSAAPPAPNAKMPKDQAARVVEGACRLSPFPGDRMIAARFLGRSVIVRELLPQDLKLEMDQLTREEATAAARFLAAVVGKAHARQMEPAMRGKWSEMNKHKSKDLAAPSWLWSSVVELIAAHETAYLDHCRTYAE